MICLSSAVRQVSPRKLKFPFAYLTALATTLLLGPASCNGSPDFAAEREGLVQEIERQVRETRNELGTDQLAPSVIDAIREVPRHAFVPTALRSEAYANHPLPIGNGQTISQPYIVAIMSHLLRVGRGDKVFELGTGSGYQAAVLAEMGVEVYSVEIVPELAAHADETLRRLGYEKVQVRAGDGYLGWPEAAPFDGIIVTAAVDRIPRPLLDQLAPNGRLVIPLGKAGWVQELVVMEKTLSGTMKRTNVLPVRFVPVTGPSVAE
jgi:protein-L-isoaspartate(D-aspartate) O-methyltransferase